MFICKRALIIGLGLFLSVCWASAAFGAYGDYSSSLPAWLDQNETSADGHYIIHYTDDVHHSAPYVGDPDADGDSLPDPWEMDFIGNAASGQNADSDADGYDNLDEFNAGSWPNEDDFRPLDTISPAVNGAGQNLIAQDVIDVLAFCEGRYDAWGFNPPWGLPLGVHIRYTPFGGSTITLDRSSVSKDDSPELLEALFETYFDNGGLQVMPNVVDVETLRDAKVHPEQHGSLVVRATGYSARFVDLSPGLQDIIIARTAHAAH